MKKVLILAVLLLSGCGEWVYDVEIKKAIELCSKNDGIDYIHEFMNSTTVICNNGARFALVL